MHKDKMYGIAQTGLSGAISTCLAFIILIPSMKSPIDGYHLYSLCFFIFSLIPLVVSFCICKFSVELTSEIPDAIDSRLLIMSLTGFITLFIGFVILCLSIASYVASVLVASIFFVCLVLRPKFSFEKVHNK